MKKLLYTLVFLCLLGNNRASACDVCGCSVNSGGVGLLAHYGSKFAGMTYLLAPFESSHSHEQKYIDYLHQIHVSFSLFIYKNIKLTALPAYKYNDRHIDDRTNSIHGLGDLKVQISIPIIRSSDEAPNQWRVDLTLGTKLPIGKYKPDLHALNLPENFAIGQGNYSLYIAPSFSVKNAKNVLYINTYGQYNTRSFDGFKYGSQLSTQVYYAYEYEYKNTTLIPLIGGNYEYVSSNKYSNNKVIQNSGGQGLFAFSGMHIKWKNIFIGGTYSYPIFQNYSNKEVHAIARWTSQITYIF